MGLHKKWGIPQLNHRTFGYPILRQVQFEWHWMARHKLKIQPLTKWRKPRGFTTPLCFQLRLFRYRLKREKDIWSTCSSTWFSHLLGISNCNVWFPDGIFLFLWRRCTPLHTDTHTLTLTHFHYPIPISLLSHLASVLLSWLVLLNVAMFFASFLATFFLYHAQHISTHLVAVWAPCRPQVHFVTSGRQAKRPWPAGCMQLTNWLWKCWRRRGHLLVALKNEHVGTMDVQWCIWIDVYT